MEKKFIINLFDTLIFPYAGNIIVEYSGHKNYVEEYNKTINEIPKLNKYKYLPYIYYGYKFEQLFPKNCISLFFYYDVLKHIQETTYFIKVKLDFPFDAIDEDVIQYYALNNLPYSKVKEYKYLNQTVYL